MGACNPKPINGILAVELQDAIEKKDNEEAKRLIYRGTPLAYMQNLYQAFNDDADAFYPPFDTAPRPVTGRINYAVNTAAMYANIEILKILLEKPFNQPLNLTTFYPNLAQAEHGNYANGGRLPFSRFNIIQCMILNYVKEKITKDELTETYKFLLEKNPELIRSLSPSTVPLDYFDGYPGIVGISRAKREEITNTLAALSTTQPANDQSQPARHRAKL